MQLGRLENEHGLPYEALPTYTRQVRHWCFTVNNPGDGFRIWNEDLDGGIPTLGYGIFQIERGADGTEHAQGYLEFSHSKTMGGVKLLPGLSRAHLEPRRGTREQAADYCRKEDTRLRGPFEFGQLYTKKKHKDHTICQELLGLEVKELEMICPASSAYLTTLTNRILSNALQTNTSGRSFETIAEFLSTWASLNPKEARRPKYGCYMEGLEPGKVTSRSNTQLKRTRTGSNGGGGGTTTWDRKPS